MVWIDAYPVHGISVIMPPPGLFRMKLTQPVFFYRKTGIGACIHGIIRGSSRRPIARRLACSGLVERSME
jgi:hypothetical protein